MCFIILNLQQCEFKCACPRFGNASCIRKSNDVRQIRYIRVWSSLLSLKCGGCQLKSNVEPFWWGKSIIISLLSRPCAWRRLSVSKRCCLEVTEVTCLKCKKHAVTPRLSILCCCWWCCYYFFVQLHHVGSWLINQTNLNEMLWRRLRYYDVIQANFYSIIT